MNLYWQGQTGPEILMKAGVCQIEWLKQKVRAKEFRAWLLWSMVYTIYMHLWSHVYLYTHMEFPEIFVPQRRQHDLLPGGSGRLGGEEGRRSKAGTWRLNQLILFVSSIFMIFHLSQQNASHRVYSQNGQKMLEVNMTFPLLLVEKIGCRDCSAFVLCVSPSFAKSQVLPTQVESASWRGPEDHAGRVQVQAVPPQQSAPIEDQRGSYFVHTNQLPTLLFGTDTLLLLQPAKVHYGIQEADEEQFQIFSDAVSIFFSEWSDTGIISRVVQQWSNYLQVHHAVLWHFIWNKLISSW